MSESGSLLFHLTLSIYLLFFASLASVIMNDIEKHLLSFSYALSYHVTSEHVHSLFLETYCSHYRRKCIISDIESAFPSIYYMQIGGII